MPDIKINFIGKDEVSGTMKGIGKSFSSLGGIIGKAAAGAALGGIGALAAGVAGLGVGIAASVKEGAAFTKQMSNVGAVSGASSKQLEALTQTAKDLGATTAFSGIEAAEGMQFLAQAGYKVEDIMSAMPGVLNLAAASGADLGTSADIVSNIMSGFGATADQTGQYVDLLTATFTTSNVNLQQLGESMKFAAPVAQGFGQSAEVTAASIGLLGNAGLQGATAGEKFRAILSRLAGPTDEAREVLDQLGVSVFNASGEMLPFPQILGQIEQATAGMTQEQRNAALATLFAQENAGAFRILLGQGQQTIEQYSASLRDSMGIASQVAAQQLDNLSGDVTLFQSAVSGVKLDVFDQLEPLFRAIVQAGTDLVGFLPDLIGSFDFSSVIQNLVPFVQNLVTSLKTGIPEAIKTTSNIWNTVLVPAFQAASSFFVSQLLPAFGSIFDFLKKNIPLAINFASDTWTNVLLPALKLAADYLFNTVIPAFADLGEWLLENLPGVIDKAVSAFDSFKTNVLPIIISFGEDAIVKIRDFRDNAVKWFEDFESKARPIIEEFAEKFQAAWKDAGPVIKDALERIGEAIGRIVEAFGHQSEATDTAAEAAELLQQVLDAVVIAVQAVAVGVDLLAKGFEAVANAIDIAKGLADQFGQIIQRAGQKVPSIFLPGSPPPLAVAFQDIGNSTKFASSNLSGFSQMSKTAGNNVESLIQSTSKFPAVRNNLDVLNIGLGDFTRTSADLLRLYNEQTGGFFDLPEQGIPLLERLRKEMQAAAKVQSVQDMGPFGVGGMLFSGQSEKELTTRWGSEMFVEPVRQAKEKAKEIVSEIRGKDITGNILSQAEGLVRSKVEERLAPLRERIEQEVRSSVAEGIGPLTEKATALARAQVERESTLLEASKLSNELQAAGKSTQEQNKVLGDFLGTRGLSLFDIAEPQKGFFSGLESLRDQIFQNVSQVSSIDSILSSLGFGDSEDKAITNNQQMNLTINSSAPTENLASDFNMMKASLSPV